MPNLPANPVSPFAICAHCGAQRQAGALHCWLCGGLQPEPVAPPVIVPQASKDSTGPPRDVNPWVAHGSIWAAIAAVLAVGYGVALQRPVLGVVYAVLVVPAFVVSLTLSAAARLSGKPWHPLRKVFAFVGVIGISLVLGTLIVVLLVVAAIIALLAICGGGVPL
jgi:hypothetical protein